MPGTVLGAGLEEDLEWDEGNVQVIKMSMT